jgi:5-methyltetrahydropteroyltriglutamate--homocysteine methyltransferase
MIDGCTRRLISDCGFAQEEINRRVHPSIMWAKLEAMAEGARIASRV